MSDSNYINDEIKCLSVSDLNDVNGSVVENNDGTVSVYTPNGPYFLNKICCENFDKTKNYTFDIETQKCRWKTTNCLLDNLKITINPYGNDGNIFYVDNSNETCDLKISFDYLFKINCETLTSILNNSNQSPEQIAISNQILNIELQITEQQAICETISNNITQLNLVISQTSYSIECNFFTSEKPRPPKPKPPIFKPFEKSGFNSGIPFQLPSTLLNYGGKRTLCLTEEGLAAWSEILGDRYNDFINGVATSYSCKDFILLSNLNDSIILSNQTNNAQQPLLAFECTTPFGTRTELQNDLDDLIVQQNECLDTLDTLNTSLIEAQTSLEQVSPNSCSRPIDVFETLDVDITLDIVTSTGLTTVATYSLLSPIGGGNLYTYLVNNVDTGFLVCGEPNTNQTTTGCTPMDINSLDNVYSCSELSENLFNELFIESGLLDDTIFRNTLTGNSFSSNWLHHETIVNDLDIINAIVNKKIKLSIKINHSCSDFCVLIDNIHLDKSCTHVSDNKIFISKPPSFELERIIDNKKSWIANTTFTNRTFDIKNNVSTNPIRQTDYDVNDERLVINTKEIDLDISIASAIETDVWCYIADNPCLLTALTQTNNCLCDSSYCCSGDSNVDFSSLMTQPLSAITTIEDFEYYLTSELIDVKSRKVLSGYPTLRALYDRYTNSSEYCTTTSSAFDYFNMDEFSHLIDSYWVDIVEQVVPATTIWGSVKIYGNTIFDQQKFKYRKYTTLFCDDYFSGETVPSPINGVSGQSVNVSVEQTIINKQLNNVLTIKNPTTKCGVVNISQMNNGSEFIGKIYAMSSDGVDLSFGRI
jgi:hypothetical protein